MAFIISLFPVLSPCLCVPVVVFSSFNAAARTGQAERGLYRENLIYRINKLY